MGKTKDLDSKDNGYKNKDSREYRLDPYDPYARYYKTDSGLDSKESEYEMRSILNGYKNKGYNQNDKNDKNYRVDPYNPYQREYRQLCCADGEELRGTLCYPL